MLHFCTERKENGLTDLVRVGTEQPNHVCVRRGWQWSSHAEDRQGWRFPCSGVAVEVSKRTFTQEVRDTPLSYVALYLYCCTDREIPEPSSTCLFFLLMFQHTHTVFL